MKKIIFALLFLVLMLYSCLFPQITLEASKTGIRIWFEQILPALLPFTILSGILVKSNFLRSFSKNPQSISSILTVFCGFVFGFPIGAKLSADFYKNGLLSERQAYLFAILANNFSPMYIRAYVLPTLFGTEAETYQTWTYLLLYGVPLLFLLFASLKEAWNSSQTKLSAAEKSFTFDTKIMDDGIIQGFEALIRICGYMVCFSVLAAVCCNFWEEPPFAWNWLLGNLEISNGIFLLSQSSAPSPVIYIAAVQLLSFGGCSGIAQTASIFQSSATNAAEQKPLLISKYIIGKVILSLSLTFLSFILCGTH